MNKVLHITSGDRAGDILEKSRVPGEVFVWHDILYEGPRKPGWPDEDTLHARARFLEETTGGGLDKHCVLETLRFQYAKLETAMQYDSVVLWFDACLFDQSMLCHILTCLRSLGAASIELLCIDVFPGIEPFHGLGQLEPDQMASIYDQRRPLTEEQFLFAEWVDRAFAHQNHTDFEKLADLGEAPLPWVPAAVTRWIEEQPDAQTGFTRLERFALEAINSGCNSPAQVFSFVSNRETPPQFWGDITLWAKINALANRKPPLIRIDGPMDRLPQWEGIADIERFRLHPSAEATQYLPLI